MGTGMGVGDGDGMGWKTGMGTGRGCVGWGVYVNMGSHRHFTRPWHYATGATLVAIKVLLFYATTARSADVGLL